MDKRVPAIDPLLLTTRGAHIIYYEEISYDFRGYADHGFGGQCRYRHESPAAQTGSAPPSSATTPPCTAPPSGSACPVQAPSGSASQVQAPSGTASQVQAPSRPPQVQASSGSPSPTSWQGAREKEISEMKDNMREDRDTLSRGLLGFFSVRGGEASSKPSSVRSKAVGLRADNCRVRKPYKRFRPLP